MIMAEVDINNVLDMLMEISEDPVTPKNVKERMTKVVGILKENCDVSMKISKALSELDEVIGDNNMQQHTRTEIWNVVSLLEKN